VKKVRRGDLSLSASRDDLISEAADIFIYLLKLSNQLGFDLTEAYLKKASFNEARFSGYKK
jgi:NTP pyrophosphatase (non-canonical NTP hydrolase)